MNPRLLDAITGCAMDDAFWAEHPSLEKIAETGSQGQYDDGFVDIGGVRIPKKALYGLAMGGLGGAAGGVAGKMSPQQIALLVALGAASGGLSGYGLHALDSVTESDTPGKSRTQAALDAAKNRANGEKAADSGGFATNLGNVVAGNPTNTTLEGAGIAGQAAAGGYIGNTAQRMWRMHKLTKLLDARRGALAHGDDVTAHNTAIAGELGEEAAKPTAPGGEDKGGKLTSADFDDLAAKHTDALHARHNAALAGVTPGLGGEISALRGKVDRGVLGALGMHGAQPWDLTAQKMPSPALAAAVKRNFSPMSASAPVKTEGLSGIWDRAKELPNQFGRNGIGTALGAAAALALPSIRAFDSGDAAHGIGPVSSAINSVRGRW